MKLEDQFENPIMRHDLCRNETEETIEQLVEITENFAIGFFDWAQVNAYKYPTETTTKQLLEIYKETL